MSDCRRFVTMPKSRRVTGPFRRWAVGADEAETSEGACGSRRKPMIPGAFAYHRPKSVNEAVALLADLGEDARPLAGGHSLIPADEAPPCRAVAPRRSRRDRRPEGHQVRRRRHRDRRQRHPARGDRLRSPCREVPLLAEAALPDRRPAGALSRHARRQRRERRSRQRHAGGDDGARRHLSSSPARAASDASRRATSTTAPTDTR